LTPQAWPLGGHLIKNILMNEKKKKQDRTYGRGQGSSRGRGSYQNKVESRSQNLVKVESGTESENGET